MTPVAITELMRLMRLTREVTFDDDFKHLRQEIQNSECVLPKLPSGIDPIAHTFTTAANLASMVSPDRNMIKAIIFHGFGAGTNDKDVSGLLEGLNKAQTLSGRGINVEKADNFRHLLVTLAQDIRVVIIMIIDRLTLLREINHHPDTDFVRSAAFEASCLYAPLAHRLGLYKIKGEIEDLSLKYTDRETYNRIANDLSETKAAREEYIQKFITPIRQKLEHEKMDFEIKGRTKSIYSIWNKLKKQNVDISGVYDLFAIRIILNTHIEAEKAECWKVYSIIADMYTPNPARLKDWLSIPKSNGYESLHTTVRGPENKWVEVQIRTRRMDLIAEKGLAAHWKYKGGTADGSLDAWMNNIRDILETADGPMSLMRNFSADLYDKEVFVFSPGGDLYRLPLGATVLDFAFAIHSKLGCTCTGAKVNGSSRKITHKLASGDTVEIMTRPDQFPKTDWLGWVITSKARNKIRQSINQRQAKTSELGREILQRRFKNRKIEVEEALLHKLIKKEGYKTINDFYAALADEKIDVSQFLDLYERELTKNISSDSKTETAIDYTLNPDEALEHSNSPLIIGQGIKGINYAMARCCNPIYGDDVFGFIGSQGTVKIHRRDCPNATYMHRRHPMRIIPVRWHEGINNLTTVTLKIIGKDDIGIVNNITSIINKQPGCRLRSISVDSSAGLFSGFLAINLDPNTSLSSLIKKLQTVKGLRSITRQ